MFPSDFLFIAYLLNSNYEKSAKCNPSFRRGRFFSILPKYWQVSKYTAMLRELTFPKKGKELSLKFAMVNLCNDGTKDFVECRKFIWPFLSIADITWKVYLGQNILYHGQKIWPLNKHTKLKLNTKPEISFPVAMKGGHCCYEKFYIENLNSFFHQKKKLFWSNLKHYTCSNDHLYKATTRLRGSMLSSPKQISIQSLPNKTTTCLRRPAITFLSPKWKQTCLKQPLKTLCSEVMGTYIRNNA